MNSIIKYLSQPYPQVENIWKVILPISGFIGLFMVVFQPFGLYSLQVEYKSLLLSGYGLVTFLILVFDLYLLPVLLPGLFRAEKWTVLSELLNLAWILFTVGLANLVYSSFTIGFTLDLNNIIVFQAYTLFIGMIPITALTLIKQSYLKQKNEGTAVSINENLAPHLHTHHPEQVVRFMGDNLKDELTVAADDILFIRSDGNYITIGYLKNGKYAQTLLRNTMKYALETLAAHPFHFQCHRSWIVNLEWIERVSGNSQGLKIKLQNFSEEIPVARKNTAPFREKITGIKK